MWKEATIMTEVDARGLPCPQPVIKTKKALEAIEEGAVTVLVDSPESRENVQRFAQSEGCRVELQEREGVFYLDITKGQSSQAEPKESGDVILITSDRLGTGDKRLGEILMKAFLNTLWDYEPKPAKLLFINNGVRLTIEGSGVLETLQMLEKKGVQIFSCGTCLEYYNLKEKLRVGLVNNMYATVDALLSATKVIKI
ncbi:MAG: sulfurtransferase-like selenium metabolism protein YedF [Chloroflexi bacterium]|nr:sulfurtransferase-like selenium metabolism protein YedF [Chloroflexota bacterium]